MNNCTGTLWHSVTPHTAAACHLPGLWVKRSQLGNYKSELTVPHAESFLWPVPHKVIIFWHQPECRHGLQRAATRALQDRGRHNSSALEVGVTKAWLQVKEVVWGTDNKGADCQKFMGEGDVKGYSQLRYFTIKLLQWYALPIAQNLQQKMLVGTPCPCTGAPSPARVLWMMLMNGTLLQKAWQSLRIEIAKKTFWKFRKGYTFKS